MPEAIMTISDQFPGRRKMLERLLLPNGFGTVDQVDHRPVRNEKAAVDQAAVSSRFFAETAHQFAVKLNGSKASRGRDRSDRRSLPMTAMEGDETGDIDIGERKSFG